MCPLVKWYIQIDIYKYHIHTDIEGGTTNKNLKTQSTRIRWFVQESNWDENEQYRETRNERRDGCDVSWRVLETPDWKRSLWSMERFLVFLFWECQKPLQGYLMWRSNLPNPVTIKPLPNKHENPFTRMTIDLWLWCKLDYDEHWETGQMTLDMGQWKTIQTILGPLVWMGMMLRTNHTEHTVFVYYNG